MIWNPDGALIDPSSPRSLLVPLDGKYVKVDRHEYGAFLMGGDVPEGMKPKKPPVDTFGLAPTDPLISSGY